MLQKSAELSLIPFTSLFKTNFQPYCKPGILRSRGRRLPYPQPSSSIYSTSINAMTICPVHREKFGLSWRQGSTARCRVSEELSNHDRRGKKWPKCDRGIGNIDSLPILKKTGVFLQIGSGEFTFCILHFLRYLCILSKNPQAASGRIKRVDSHSKFHSSFHWSQCINADGKIESGKLWSRISIVSLPSVILLSISQQTPCRSSLFNLFVSIKLEETGDWSHHIFLLSQNAWNIWLVPSGFRWV